MGTNGNRETHGNIPAVKVSLRRLHGDAFSLGYQDLGLMLAFPCSASIERVSPVAIMVRVASIEA